MKKILHILVILIVILLVTVSVQAQCSVCTKTSLQMGEKPAQGMNSGILYLMMTPFAIVGFIYYRWWKSNKKMEEQDQPNNSL